MLLTESLWKQKCYVFVYFRALMSELYLQLMAS